VLGLELGVGFAFSLDHVVLDAVLNVVLLIECMERISTFACRRETLLLRAVLRLPGCQGRHHKELYDCGQVLELELCAGILNMFEHQHAGQGLFKRQMSLLYKHQSKTSASASIATARSKATPTIQKQTSNALAKPARRANGFNEFQKQYKADHPDEKLSAGQLAQLYRKKQHEQ
jgi:hypothetical protein